ncbi:MAG: hypothetical protein HKN93_09645 [Acidimicrobiia bacterium]|nr:hypothetical protein [Acidimicrobiia bacterium]
MRRGTAYLALATAVVLATGCGGGDSGGDTPRATTSAGTTTTSSGVATTGGDPVTTTTAGPSTTATPYEEFITDPEAFLAAHVDLIETPQVILRESPDYGTTEDFRSEVVAQGIDLTGVEVLVWPVAATDDIFLVFSFDTTAKAFEEGDEGDLLGMAMATSSTLESAGITQLVIIWEGSDAGGPFSMTFMAPFEAVRRATLDGTDLEQGEVFARVSRGQS